MNINKANSNKDKILGIEKMLCGVDYSKLKYQQIKLLFNILYKISTKDPYRDATYYADIKYFKRMLSIKKSVTYGEIFELLYGLEFNKFTFNNKESVSFLSNVKVANNNATFEDICGFDLAFNIIII